MERAPEVLDGLLAEGGVTRAVGYEEPVVSLLLDVVVPRHYCQLNARRYERADDVVLHTCIKALLRLLMPCIKALPVLRLY